MWCWKHGTEGGGSGDDKGESVSVPTMKNVSEVNVGYGQACSVSKKGELNCWMF